MKIIKIINIYFLLTLCIGCNKWIDIQPSDRMTEEKLFENKEGFMKALNGVYIEMASPSLYGQFMTAGEIDVMGQYYYGTATTGPFYGYMNYAYSDATPKAGFAAVWSKTYAMIYNLNVLLENCGSSPSAKLPETYYGLIKGEALALRAYLHFDLLRLFGPIYNDANKGQPAIPYYTDSSREIAPLYSSEEIMKRVMIDMEEAKGLLKQYDPILTTGLGNKSQTTGDNTFSFRQYRLNYYALKALEARMYLWQGDRVNAGKLAKETIAEVQQQGKELFPFVTAASVNHNSAPDRIFASEVMFSLYKLNRVNIYNNLFSPTLTAAIRLSTNAGNADRVKIDAMYDDKNDYRYKIWENVAQYNLTLLINQKYNELSNSPGQYMVPLVRIGELYLIAAECSDDLTEAKSYLNTLRLKRNALNLNPSNNTALMQNIASEFRRELFGEGQEFFFYKRKAYTEIPNNAVATGNKAMPLNNYRVPLPDNEIAVRPNP